MTSTSMSSAVEGRHSLLLRKIQKVGSANRAWQLHRMLFVAGSVAIPLGLLFLVLGWVGVARTVLVFDQLPYLASGGLIGLALVVLGGFLYFAHWQSLLLEDNREQRRLIVQHQADVLDRLDRLTSALLASSGLADAGPDSSAALGDQLVVTESGSMVHRTSCPMVRGRDQLRQVTATEANEYRACRICKPTG